MNTRPSNDDRIFRVLCARALQRGGEGFPSTEEEIALFEGSYEPTPQEKVQFDAKLDQIIEQAAAIVAMDIKSESISSSTRKSSISQRLSHIRETDGPRAVVGGPEQRIAGGHPKAPIHHRTSEEGRSLVDGISKSKVLRLAVAISLAAALLVAVLYLSLGCPTVGRVDALSGVFTANSGKEVALGEAVAAGERYRLASGSRAKLTLDDGSTLKLEGDAILRMEAVRHVVLDSGIVEADVASSSDSFVVDTPCATIRVVGTRFRVIASARQTTVEVSKGSVRVTNRQGSLKLNAGETAFAVAEAAPVNKATELTRLPVPGRQTGKQREEKATHIVPKKQSQREEAKTADVDATQAIAQEERVIITGSILDDQGRAISDAVIFAGFKKQYHWYWDMISPTRQGTVMEDGSYTLDVTDIIRGKPEEISVIASAYGYEAQCKVMDIGKVFEADFNLAPDAVIVSGTVVDETGMPVAGAMLEACAYHYGNQGTYGRLNEPKKTITDERGRFGMTGEHRVGSWDIRAMSPMYAPHIVQEVVSNTHGLQIRLTHGGSVTGRVTHGITGRPVQRAQISILSGRNSSGSMPDRTGVSGEDGRYVVANLSPRQCQIRATTNRLFGPKKEVIVQEGRATTDVNFTLMPGGKVSGRVYDAETGAPLSDVSVELFAAGLRPLHTSTDREGCYRFKDVPYGKVHVRVSLWRSGYCSESGSDPGRMESAAQTITLETRSKIDGIDFPLRKAATISGAIRDSQGQPVPDAKACIYANDGGALMRIAANDTGYFKFMSVRPQNSYHLYAEADGFARTRSKEVDVREARHYTDIDFVLYKGGSLKGRTVYENGIAVARVNVSLHSEDSSLPDPPWVVSSDQGEFLFKHIPSGTYRIRAKKGHLLEEAGHVTFEEGIEAAQLEIVMKSPGNGVIEGYVRDDLGSPVGGAYVHGWWADKERKAQLRTDATGHYRIENVPNGRISLSIYKPGYTSFYDKVICENLVTKDVTLERSGSISGQVVASGGKPVKEFQITPSVIRDGRRSKRRSKDFKTLEGRFILEGLSPGQVVLEISAKGYATAQSDALELSPGGHVRDVSLSLQPEGTVRGVVRTEFGAPIIGAYVCVGTMPYSIKDMNRVRHVLTAEDGSFTLGNLNQGDYTTAVMHKDYAPKVIENIYVPYGAAAQEIEIILTPGARLTGTIYEGQEPVPNADVHLAREDAYKLRTSTTTDAEGGYVFDHLAPGRYVVRWSKRAGGVTIYETQRTVEAIADETITLDFTPLGTLTVQGLVTFDGKPVRCTVRIRAPSDDAPYGYIVLGTASTQADGSYIIRWLPSGVYLISAGTRDAGFRGKIEIPEKGEVQYNIELQPR